MRDGGGIGDRRQQQHRRRLGLAGYLQRNARLADPAGTDERHQPLGGEQPAELPALRLPAAQPGRR
ncbi:MAG: hypothetical protein ACRDRY_20165, partial [Pseudonocardiaceae bacterium]